MQREVSDFIVVAPAMLGKAVEWAKPRLLEYLGSQFPNYRFHVEAFGPFADEEEFTVIPIMNRAPEPDEGKQSDAIIMCTLPQQAIPNIEEALRAFDPDKVRVH